MKVEKWKQCVVIVFSLLLCGCFYTDRLWEKERVVVSLKGFYLNKESNLLIAATQRDAYVFNISNQLVEVLSLAEEADLHPDFSGFKISQNQKVSGVLELSYDSEGKPLELTEKLEALGFGEGEGRLGELGEEFHINGERYHVEGEIPFESFQESYRISVTVPRTFSRLATNIVATPGAMALDTVSFAIGGTAMVIVFSLLAFSTYSNSHDAKEASWASDG